MFTVTTTIFKGKMMEITPGKSVSTCYRRKEPKIFGRAYIPETPGVNPKEEKEVEFGSEVLIRASTFQAAVGEGKKRKKKQSFRLLAMLKKLAI